MRVLFDPGSTSASGKKLEEMVSMPGKGAMAMWVKFLSSPQPWIVTRVPTTPPLQDGRRSSRAIISLRGTKRKLS
jgi:hypothetical protein